MAVSALLHNPDTLPLADLPLLDFSAFRGALVSAVAGGGRVVSMFGYPGPLKRSRLVAILAHDRAGSLEVISTEVGAEYPALTPDCPQAHWFEHIIEDGVEELFACAVANASVDVVLLEFLKVLELRPVVGEVVIAAECLKICEYGISLKVARLIHRHALSTV